MITIYRIVAEVLLEYTGLRIEIFCEDYPSFNFWVCHCDRRGLTEVGHQASAVLLGSFGICGSHDSFRLLGVQLNFLVGSVTGRDLSLGDAVSRRRPKFHYALAKEFYGYAMATRILSRQNLRKLASFALQNISQRQLISPCPPVLR